MARYRLREEILRHTNPYLHEAEKIGKSLAVLCFVSRKHSNHIYVQAGFLTCPFFGEPSRPPLSADSGHAGLKNHSGIYSSGSVQDFYLIPFYALPDRVLHHLNGCKDRVFGRHLKVCDE